MKVKVLGRGLRIDEFVSKTELAQSFQRYELFQKLLVKFRIRNESCEILEVKELRSLLSLTEVKRTKGSDMFGSFFCLITTIQKSWEIRNSNLEQKTCQTNSSSSDLK